MNRNHCRRVVVTGIGAVTPYGEGRERYWQNLRAGRSAVNTLRLFDAGGLSSRVAAEVHDWRPEAIVSKKELRRLPRVAIMSIGATREAFEDAGIAPDELTLEQLQRTAVILGTSSGGIEFAEAQYKRYFEGEVDGRCYPFAISSAFVGMLSSEVAIAFGLRGMSHVISTGCTSATDAIGHAFRTIQHGHADRVVTGGADCCITPAILECYVRMGCVSTAFNDTPARASRPFNRDRDGFVIGEGAWMFVLESLESALEREAPIYAELMGYGATCDAFHRVQIMPDGVESARAMTLALEDAEVRTDQIQYVNLHGTSTQLNDKTETVALKQAFNGSSRTVATSATKSLIGHPQGASGAAGLAATLLTIRDSYIHPTINQENPDPDCDLDYVPNSGRERQVDYAMSNCIAFGSKNAALVVGRHEKGARRVNILLVSQNRERVPYPVMPIGQCYIAEALEREGHDVTFLDLCFERKPARAVEAAVGASRPHLVGVSLRNLDNCDAYVPKNFVPEAAALVSHLRSLTDAPVVIGGSAVSVMPAAVTRAVRPNYAVTGDGERAMAALANALACGEDPSGLPGVCSLEGERVVVNPPSPVPDLDLNIRPRIYRWVDTRAYMKFEGVYPLQSKRGCSLGCIYCTYRNIEGKRYRFKSGDETADEIDEIIRQSGVRDFEFVDSTFNVPERHAHDICEAVIRRGLDVNFVGSGLNPVTVSPDLLGVMKRAGFSSLVVTAESGSDPVLASLRKGFTRAHIERLAAMTRQVGLRTLWIFLVGGPNETQETVLETLDFFHRHTAPGDVAFITNGLRIYPRTPLARTALDEGVIDHEPELIEPRFYFSPALDRNWLRQTMLEHARRDPRLITAERSQNPIVPFGLRLLAAAGVRKPFWRFAPVLNRLLRFAS